MKRSEIYAAQEIVRRQLASAGIVVNDETPVEIADFGLGRYHAEGLGLVVRVNEPEYCSKWLTLTPGQQCPMHYHKVKKETFFVLQGTVVVRTSNETVTLNPGDRYTLFPGTPHTFGSVAGAVIEEVSTHDENADSYFENAAVIRDPVSEED
ncbi:MAG: D-lyxose/D-mannose family sugar isomerase [Capsulimonadaceae bacterium]|nr:D-lyxose/D-mannose family sugar isomerase [Capsulimonadaceae bacterium]